MNSRSDPLRELPSISLRAARTLQAIALLGIAMIAVMRCMILFTPQVYFDVDPAFYPAPLAAMGLAGSFMLDVLLLMFCAAGFLGMTLAKRRLDWRLMALAMIPVPVILLHGWSDAGDLWRGSTWAAALIAAVVVAHLTHDRSQRTIFIAIMLAVAAPLLLRGAMQMTVEHAQTLQTFEQNREAFLADRGWEPGSPSALIYERRLRQPQPTGWFETTNIFASLITAMAIALAGLCIGAARARLGRLWTVMLALLAVMCAAGVFWTGSKGAMLAMLAGITVCAIPLVTPQIGSRLQDKGWVLLLALPIIAIVGVLARGLLLPEGFLGEKSLLFRWHYLLSSIEMFFSQPLTGVGPDGFQAAYTGARLPRNPEEVISAHAVFTDWLATLGIIGASWIALMLMLLKRAGETLSDSVRAQHDQHPNVGPLMLRGAVATVFVATGVGLWTELHVLEPSAIASRLAGAVGFVALALILARLLERIDWKVINWSLAAAAAALLMHSQIEMTMFLHGSVLWSMCLIGVAAGGAGFGPTPASRSAVALSCTAIALALACWLYVTAALPAMSQQRLLQQAVDQLHPVALTNPQQIQQRRLAADSLIAAYEAMPTNALPLRSAARQHEIAASMAATANDRAIALRDAIAVADRLVDEDPGAASLANRAGLHAQLARLTNDEAAWQAAVDDARAVTALDPHGNQAWAVLGDYLWLADRQHEAAAAYQRAMKADDNFELDPLKQFPQRRRDEMQRRIDEVREPE